jgi:N utilization substance protein A
VDPETKSLEVIVEDTQLSLAIGKKGQNVRLASKLIGWNIDIKSEEEKRQELEAQMVALSAPGTPLAELAGVGPKTIEKIEAAGITTIEKLADMTPEQLMEIPGIGEKMIEKIHLSVKDYFEALEARQAAEAATAAEAAANPESAEAAPAAEVETPAPETEASDQAPSENPVEAAAPEPSEESSGEATPAEPEVAVEESEPADPRPDEE